MKYIGYKNNLLFFNFNYIYNKNKARNKLLLNKKTFQFFNFFLVFLIYNIAYKKIFLFFKYYSFRIIWYLLLCSYKMINLKLKIKMKLLFKKFLLKNTILAFIKKFVSKKKIYNKIFFFKFFPLNNILKIKKACIKNIYFNRLIKKRKKLKKINFAVRKKGFYKKKRRNKFKKKIQMSLFFFSKYKRMLYVMLINFLYKIWSLKAKLRAAFVSYWKRFYIYFLKHIFIKIERLMKKSIVYWRKSYVNLYSFINLSKKKKFFNGIQLLKKLYYKKNYFNIINFFLKKNSKKNVLYKFKKFFNLLNYFEKVKFMIFLKYFIYIFIIQFFLFWFNSYFSKENIIVYNNTFISNCSLIQSDIYNNMFFLKKRKKWNNALIIKYMYFFFGNIII